MRFFPAGVLVSRVLYPMLDKRSVGIKIKSIGEFFNTPTRKTNNEKTPKSEEKVKLKMLSMFGSSLNPDGSLVIKF